VFSALLFAAWFNTVNMKFIGAGKFRLTKTPGNTQPVAQLKKFYLGKTFA